MKNTSTQGEDKVLLQFERFTETNIFKEKVKQARKRIGLPLKGLKITKDDLEAFPDPYTNHVPDNFSVKKIKGNLHLYFLLKVENEITRVSNLFPISNNTYLSSLIKYYIIFNKFFYKELEPLKRYLEEANVCILENAESELIKYDKIKENDFYFDEVFDQLLEYPIAIRIHREASSRDVFAYIKKQWPTIQAYIDIDTASKVVSLKYSRTKINREIQDRNNFILKHKKLPRKEINALLSKKYGFKNTMDDGSIGKIISLDKKKREKK